MEVLSIIFCWSAFASQAEGLEKLEQNGYVAIIGKCLTKSQIEQTANNGKGTKDNGTP